MSPLYATRRRAEEFEQSLQVVDAQGSWERVRRPLRRPARARWRLARGPQPQARPSSSSPCGHAWWPRSRPCRTRGRRGEVDRLRLRTPIPAASATARAPSHGRPRRSGPGRRHGDAVGGRPVGAPGRRLYPLKRGLESATPGSAWRGRQGRHPARERLDAARRGVRLDAADHPAEIADTLDDFTAQAMEASDLLLASYVETREDATVVELRSFTAQSMTSLSDLDGRLPRARRTSTCTRSPHSCASTTRRDCSCPTCAAPTSTTSLRTCPRSAPASAPARCRP